MKKRSSKQNTWVAGLGLLICLNLVTASPTMAAVGYVRSSQKISATSGNLTNVLAASDSFGRSAAGIGDLDGDGIEDLAVGTPDGATSLDGTLYVLFLNANGTVKSSQKITEGSGGFPYALSAGERFGVSAANLGDLDGDTVTDLAVGAIYNSDGPANAGAVYVLFMNTNGMVKSSQKLSATSGNLTNSFPGTNRLDASDQFGISAAGIGDLDGDSLPDLAAGAYADDDGGADKGAVYVLFLNANGTVKSSQKISATSGNLTNSFPGTNRLDAFDYFGISAAGIGDLNGDGVLDLAVGAQGDDDGASAAGAVYVLFLNTNGTVNSSQKISKTSGNFTNMLDASDYFGTSMAGISNLSGDGVAEFVVGAQGDDDGVAEVGALYVLFLNTNGTVNSSQKIGRTSGNLTNTFVSTNTIDTNDRFGIGPAGIGDLNGDGVVDLAAGTDYDDDGADGAGAVYILMLEGVPPPAGTIFKFR